MGTEFASERARRQTEDTTSVELFNLLTTLEACRSMPAPTAYEAGKRQAYTQVAAILRELISPNGA